jgi:cold shock CspA family protein
MEKGRLKSWVDERGFGFIQLENSTEEVFFHISALKVEERRPEEGDVVHFTVVQDANGRKKAESVSIEGVKSVFSGQDISKSKLHQPRRKQQPNKIYRDATSRGVNGPSRFATGVVTVVVVLMLVSAVAKFGKANLPGDMEMTRPENSETWLASEHSPESGFHCAGKSHCSQMTSCAEATFYLNNCPGSITDGDSDGRPCEDQWCGH